MKISHALEQLQEIQKAYPDIELRYEDIHDDIYRRLEGFEVRTRKTIDYTTNTSTEKITHFILCF